MIPHIVHQTAPSDKKRWKPVWSLCQSSVQQNFSDWQYVLWNDEDLDRLVQQHFSWFYPIFRSYPEPIFRADAGRYMILYIYGGLYLDMDYEVLCNFQHRLDPKRPNIVESPFPNVENVQNSLMASPPRHPFWLEVLREMASCSTIFHHSVLDATGPRMLDRVLSQTKQGTIRILPMTQFNPPPVGDIYNATQWRTFTSAPVYARHRCSASWR